MLRQCSRDRLYDILFLGSIIFKIESTYCLFPDENKINS